MECVWAMAYTVTFKTIKANQARSHRARFSSSLPAVCDVGAPLYSFLPNAFGEAPRLHRTHEKGWLWMILTSQSRTKQCVDSDL